MKEPLLYKRLRFQRLVIAVILGSLMVLDWRSSILYLGIPWLFSQWCIVTINLFQHQDCEEDSVFNHSRNITSRFSNWFLLNNGFHTAHHLKPNLHWSLLPEFHRQYVEPKMRSDLNERFLVVAAWRRYFSSTQPRKFP